MTKKQIIICVAIGLIVVLTVGFFVCITAPNGDDTNNVDTSDTNISITPPSDTFDSTDTTDDSMLNPPMITEPESESINDTPETSYTEVEELPKVENYTEENVNDKTYTEKDTEIKDIVIEESKDKNTQQTGPTSGEDRNDEIIKEKEELAPKVEEEQKEATLTNEETNVGSEKGEAIERNEETNTDGGNKNAPEYIPSHGGDNPFDDDTKTEINDKPVDDYIDEGEDRPGEGVHF